MDGETLQLKTTCKGRKNSQLQDLHRQEGGGECTWKISDSGYYWAPWSIGQSFLSENCFTCVVLHNMLRTHQAREDGAPTPANDVVALQNEQVVYVPHDNYRNPSREAKHQ